MAGAATVEKALDVLFHLHAAGTALGLSEIGRDLDLPKSSCHRLLSSLVEREVVERDAGGRYRPGLALVSLGLGAQAQEPVVRAARTSLEAVAAALGETVFLVGRRRGRLRVLDKCEGHGFLRAAPEIGDVIPAEVTAVGRLYRVFGTLLEEGGLGDAEDGVVAERGYATNRGAWIEGLSVLAVPIWQDHSGGRSEMIASLALGAASGRFEEIGERRIADRLVAAADHVARVLGLPPQATATARRAPSARAADRGLASARREGTRS